MAEEGNKIKKEYRNPIDNILIDFSDPLGKILIKYPCITPNVITTFSLISSLTGTYFIHNGCYKVGSILAFVGYFFDCLDGNFARKYDMVTDFGDMYDHFTDVITHILLIYVLLKSSLKKKTKILFTVLSLLGVLFTGIHMGCEEKITNEKRGNKFLSFTKFLCSNENHIGYLRHFGSGTQFLILYVFIFNLKCIDYVL